MGFDPYWFKSGSQVTQGKSNWDFAGPLVLTLLPAGHRPGLYMVSSGLFISTAAGAGNCNGSFLSWTDPLFGAATLLFGNISLTATGHNFSSARPLLSSGVGAFTYSITPAGVTGSPRGNLYAYAEYMSRLPPS